MFDVSGQCTWINACIRCLDDRFFTVLNLDSTPQFQAISKGLKIDEANQEEMKAMLKAQKRFEFQEEHRNVHSLKPLEVRL